MEPTHNPTAAGELATASLALGLFALAVCWWFPFGAILSAAGLAIGAAACWLGRRSRLRAFGAMTLCAAALGSALASAWGTYVRVFGL